ncbi:carbohydrate ABC transporter permease [Cohnella yongneupensis]|uniref:Carbohydrate ABC transporter permease n=1 Tax=Cohnella yongneupensis TaxID=425006 RepID=A0ABW0QZU4_9BACL
MKRRRLSRHTLSNLEGMLFIAPWIIGFMMFLAFPLAYSLYMSFHNVRILPTGPQITYKGWGYYNEILFSGSALYDELIPFMQEALIMIPIILVFSFLIAILLNQKFHGRFFFRAVFFLPVIFSTGYVVTEFVNQGQGSLGFLERYHFDAYLQSYLGDNVWTRSMMEVLSRFVLILWYSGVQIIIFLAGRQTLASSLYESARIDGASPWAIFWKITLPAMVPFIMLNLIYTVVDMFTFPFNPIIKLIGVGNYGYNSALAWIYFSIIIVFLLLLLFVFRRITRNTYRA